MIAGYHWFGDWGRDTMIGLEGLTLATGRLREAAAILRTFARYVRDGGALLIASGADFAGEGIGVVTPDLHLATVAAGGKLTLDIGIRAGRGYVSADRHGDAIPAGAIGLDAAFSPIRRVNYHVEMSRLGNITDYEKLVVEIATDGSIGPDHAFLQASKLLRDHFDLFTPAGAEEEDDEPTAAPASVEATRDA